MNRYPFRHLLFFDGECPLCNRAVRFVIAADKKQRFGFAPLQGETAQRELLDLSLETLDTLILLENFQTEQRKRLIEGRGALRILWLLGGAYALVGWLSFLPPWLFNLAYRFIAKRRYQLFSSTQALDLSSNRILK